MEHRNPIFTYLFGTPRRELEPENALPESRDDMPPLESFTDPHRHQDVDMDIAESESATHIHFHSEPQDHRARVEEVPDEEATPPSSSVPSAYSTPFLSSASTSMPMPGFQRSSTRRSRVDEDDDHERDRRHPSERVVSGSGSGSGSGSAVDALRSTAERDIRRREDGNDNTSARPFRFFRHRAPSGAGLGLSTPNAESSNSPSQPQQQNQNHEAPAQPAQQQAQPQPGQGSPQTQPQAPQQAAAQRDMETEIHAQLAEVATRLVNNLFGGLGGWQLDLAPRPAHEAPNVHQNLTNPTAANPANTNPTNPNSATNANNAGDGADDQRPIPLPHLLARLAAASPPGGAGGIPFFFPFPFPFPRGEREVEDPERAKRFVRGLESVPEGLVRRLERVGKMSEEGEGGCGDGGCAICWERLLDDEEGDEEHKENKEGEGGEQQGHEEGKAKKDEDTDVDAPLPKIVSLPCAHVFHSRCLIPWFSKPRQTTCPTCRFNIDPEGLMKRTPRPVEQEEEEEVPTEPNTPIAERNDAQPAQAHQGQPGQQQQQQQQTQAQGLPGPGREFFSLGFGFDVIIANGPPPPNLGALNVVLSLGPDGRLVNVPQEQLPLRQGQPHEQPTQEQQQGQTAQEQAQEGHHEHEGEHEREEHGDDMNVDEADQDRVDEQEVLADFQRFLDGVRGGQRRDAGTQAQGEASETSTSTSTSSPAVNQSTTPASGAAPTPQLPPRVQVREVPTPPRAGFTLPFGAPGIRLAGARAVSDTLGALFGIGPRHEQGQGQEQQQQGQQEQPQVPQRGPHHEDGEQELREREQQTREEEGREQEEASAPAPADNANTNTNTNTNTNPPPNPAAAREARLRNVIPLFDIALGPFGPRPRRGRSENKKAWTLPPAPGLSLRQRIEKKEQEAGLRCSEISCGVGPSDEDPVVAEAEQSLKQLSIHDKTNKPVCAHTFHSSCLVSAERVVLDSANVPAVGDDVEVSCPVCKSGGCVSKRDWEEGVRALQ